MKTVHGWLKVILCSAMLALLVSCASAYIPIEGMTGNMSVKQARNLLATELKGEKRGYLINDIKISDVRVTSDKLIIADAGGKQSIFILRDLSRITAQPAGFSRNYFYTIDLSDKAELELYECSECGLGSTAVRTDIANALFVLKQNAIKTKKEADEFDANFALLLPDFRKKIASNIALPEEANKYKAQAEGAVRDKEFEDAVDFYAEALRIAPWWPVGHFNRALVLGETGDYGEAMREMKHYLQLVPDAPNARAAQDKIYTWERKAGEGN